MNSFDGTRLWIRVALSVACVYGLAHSAGCLQAQETDEANQTDEAALSAPVNTVLSEADLQADPDNWRAVAPERLMVFETTKGRVLIETFPEIAPRHVAQFTAIVRSGDYAGTAFHRVIDGFMSQGGDVFALHGRTSGLPNIEAEFTFRRDPAELVFDMIGNPDQSLDGYYKGLPVRTQSSWLAELSADGLVESYVPHCQGVVSTARLGNDINSANSQFFLMRAHSPHLDKQYSPWGRILDGQEVVLSMKTGDPQVRNPDVLNKALMVADMPEAERPRVWVQKTDGPEFQAQVADLKDTHVCDLPAIAAKVFE